MNNDLISRDKLLEAFRDFKDMDCPSGHTVTADYMIELAEDAPAVDAEPVRRARWQFEARGKDGRTETPVCSGCGATPKYYVPRNDVGMQVPPYCHECGCKMDKVVKYETD